MNKQEKTSHDNACPAGINPASGVTLESAQPETRTVNISDILTDLDTLVRVEISEETVDEYAAAMNRGDTLPHIEIFDAGGFLILADGFHRLEAFKKLGKKTITANVRDGYLEEATKFALKANSQHGLRLTNRDKRKAVGIALNSWPDYSDSAIAELCAVSHTFVATVRSEQATESVAGSVEVELNRLVAAIQAGLIKKALAAWDEFNEEAAEQAAGKTLNRRPKGRR
jgi:ParB-like nuclease domain